MRVSAWPRLSRLRDSPVRLSAGLEDSLEALDETAGHRRDLVDCTCRDSTSLRLALDG